MTISSALFLTVLVFTLCHLLACCCLFACPCLVGNCCILLSSLGSTASGCFLLLTHSVQESLSLSTRCSSTSSYHLSASLEFNFNLIRKLVPQLFLNFEQQQILITSLGKTIKRFDASYQCLSVIYIIINHT